MSAVSKTIDRLLEECATIIQTGTKVWVLTGLQKIDLRSAGISLRSGRGNPSTHSEQTILYTRLQVCLPVELHFVDSIGLQAKQIERSELKIMRECDFAANQSWMR